MLMLYATLFAGKISTLQITFGLNLIDFRALQFPPEAWLRMSLNHGSITWVSITPGGRVILRTLGDSGHMPVDFITTTWDVLTKSITMENLCQSVVWGYFSILNKVGLTLQICLWFTNFKEQVNQLRRTCLDSFRISTFLFYPNKWMHA